MIQLFDINPTQTMKLQYLLYAIMAISPLLISNGIDSTVKQVPLGNQLSSYLEYAKMFSKDISKDSQQLLFRVKVYAQYIKNMNIHNADTKHTYKMGLNQFSDLTQQEFMQMYHPKVTPMNQLEVKLSKRCNEEPINQNLGADVDWRVKNTITSVKNQQQCDGGWAFAATAAHESYQIQVKKQNVSTIDLSEQQLIDCSNAAPYDNLGCNGGYAVRGLEFIKDHGQISEQQYPFAGKTQVCAIKEGTFTTFGLAEISGCTALDQLIRSHPLAVRVDSSNWASYSAGVFTNCQPNAPLTHSALLVGSTADEWILKNSWGTAWGEKGFIRLAKGNTCGVCVGPSFVIRMKP